MDKTSRLKEILYRSFVKSQGEDGSVAMYDLLSQMRTAVIIIDEIGLKQSTVSAVLLFHPFFKKNIYHRQRQSSILVPM